MPVTYKLPKLKKEENDMAVAPSIVGEENLRRIRIPASEEQVQKLSIGDEETVTLKGVVKELESREGEGMNEFVLVVTEVEIAAMNEFEALAEDEE